MSFVSLSEFVDSLLSENLTLDRDIFELLVDQAKSVGIKTGFEEEQLNNILKGILKLSLEPAQLRTLLLYMIPKNMVLSETVDFVIAWCFSHTQKSHYRKSLKPLLKWLIALIKCKIFDAKELKHTFSIFLNFLNLKEVHEEACYLLYLILDYDLVTEYTVKRLAKIKTTKSLSAVISLCRRFKPHLLEDHPILCNEIQYLPNISKKLMQNLCLWTSSPFEDTILQTRFPDWLNQTIAYKNKKTGQVCYIGDMSLAESFQAAKTLDIYYSGSSFESFLSNKFGFVYVVLGEKKFQDDTLEYIGRTLCKIEKTLNDAQEESTECFFRHVCDLQRFWQQAILPVHHFLLRSFKRWKGETYRKEILGLLSGMVITPYAQFFTDIVKPMYDLILRNEVDLSHFVLASLAMLLYNNVKYLSNSPILESSPPPKPIKEDIKRVQKCFKHFCLLYLNMNKENSVILHEVVDHHILLSELQTDIEIDYLLPNGIFYHILLNSDCLLVNKAAKLIIKKYKASTSDSGYSKELALQLCDLQKIYFGNILQTHLVSSFSNWALIHNEILKYRQIKNCFKIKNSLTFLHITRFNSAGEYEAKCDGRELRKRLESVCPDLVDLLKVLATTS